jgi:endoglucanase
MSKTRCRPRLIVSACAISIFTWGASLFAGETDERGLVLNDQDYFEMPGLNVLVYHNTFSEGHQGGVEIIQHENRVATNGEIRINRTPGQWQPVAKLGEGVQKRGVSPQSLVIKARRVDRDKNEISIPCSFPDESLNRKGFNPVIYPDLKIAYTMRVKAQGSSFTITVDFDEPVPDAWVGRVGFNLELFPGNLYGKHYFMDEQSGIFPWQAAGPAYLNDDGEAEASPLAQGHTLVVAPESELFRMKIESMSGELQLLDGSLQHNNGWFVVRSLVPAGAMSNAIRWKITPHVIPGFTYEPVVHVSQVGYHPNQKKVAYIEMDGRETELHTASLFRITESGERTEVKAQAPEKWGKYLRYNYALFDFSEVEDPGIYQIQYGDFISNTFRVDAKVYANHVWQPTLEYFIPIQMCHMRVNQKYRVWHGLCHMDDALMMPLNIRHFDGYDNEKETSTLSPFKPLDHVPGLNVGGWHDAGDYDLRVESQAQTVIALALAYEEFGSTHDNTFVDQEHRHVELHQPDGKADLLQQVEHGVLAILSGYRPLGRLYRGIICPSLRQYAMLGDGSTMTDNKVFADEAAKAQAAQLDELWFKKVANRYSKAFDPAMNLNEIEAYVPELDDRLVFTDSSPGFQLAGATGLAVASRVLREYDKELADESLRVAEELWQANKDLELNEPFFGDSQKISLLAELILTTDKEIYKTELCGMSADAARNFPLVGWSLGRVLPRIECGQFKAEITKAAKAHKTELDKMMAVSPFGVPLQRLEFIGFSYYFLHKGWPDIYAPDYLYTVVNSLLGCRPGSTTKSLVSGVGVSSPTIAYGTNRADWSYIPGGTFWSAINLVRPDLPEDKDWPYIWQEREYIIGGAAMYMFIVQAADYLLSQPATQATKTTTLTPSRGCASKSSFAAQMGCTGAPMKGKRGIVKG